jgi:hypothetical protein
LTAEEWALKDRGAPGRYRGNAEGQVWENDGQMWYGDEYPVQNRHGLAALALYGQPFGFTWDDVDAIERVVAGGELQGSLSPLSAVARQNDRLRWLIDRIAALLPPKEEG